MHISRLFQGPSFHGFKELLILLSDIHFLYQICISCPYAQESKAALGMIPSLFVWAALLIAFFTQKPMSQTLAYCVSDAGISLSSVTKGRGEKFSSLLFSNKCKKGKIFLSNNLKTFSHHSLSSPGIQYPFA